MCQQGAGFRAQLLFVSYTPLLTVGILVAGSQRDWRIVEIWRKGSHVKTAYVVAVRPQASLLAWRVAIVTHPNVLPEHLHKGRHKRAKTTIYSKPFGAKLNLPHHHQKNKSKWVRPLTITARCIEDGVTNGAIEAYLQILPKKVAQPKIHGRVLRSINTVKSPCLPSHWLTLPSWGPHYLQGHTRSAAPVTSTCSWNCYRQAQGWQSSLDAIARRLALHTCRSDFCINVQIKRDFYSQKAFALIPFEGKLKTKNTEGNMFTKT